LDEGKKRQIGEQVEPGDRAKAPGRLELLQRFVNTWNHDLPADWDRLGTAARTSAWLRESGIIRAGARVSAADAARLRDLREAIRALVVANRSGGADVKAVEAVREAAHRAPLVVAIDDNGRTRLDAPRHGVDGVIATLLAVMHDAQRTGAWQRLKGCRQCQYAFYDLSKNRSATWCSMSICGNRSKNRAYYRRHNASAR
jgi:predicted RNA-binding Zn ribbon-like protein